MPQKDDKLLQDLIRQYTRLFLKLAIKHGAPYNDAEDIVMDAFWCFYDSEHYGKLSESATRIMMARIIKNKCIDRYRKYKTEEELMFWVISTMYRGVLYAVRGIAELWSLCWEMDLL